MNFYREFDALDHLFHHLPAREFIGLYRTTCGLARNHGTRSGASAMRPGIAGQLADRGPRGESCRARWRTLRPRTSFRQTSHPAPQMRSPQCLPRFSLDGQRPGLNPRRLALIGSLCYIHAEEAMVRISRYQPVPPTAAGRGLPHSLRSAVALSPQCRLPRAAPHAQPYASEISLAFVSVVGPTERGASK